MFFELGLSRAVCHKFADAMNDNTGSDTSDILRTIECIVFPVAVLLSSTLYIFAEYIALDWLNAEGESATTVIRLIAAIIFFRWLAIFYQSVLLGMEKHFIINLGQISYQVVVPIFGLAILYATEWRLVELVICYLVGAMILTILFAYLCWKQVGRFNSASFNSNYAKELISFSIVIAGVEIPGIILMEVDKILVSKIFSIEIFGWYMLISNVVASITLLAIPSYQVAFPRFSSIITNLDKIEIKRIFKLFTQITALFIFPVAITIAIFSEPILNIYTKKPELVDLMWPVLSILVIAKALHASGMISYAYQLACNRLRLAFTINIVSILLMIICLPIMTMWLGLIGIAYSWLIVTFVYVSFGMWFFHKLFFSGGYWSWLFRDNLHVIVTSVCISFLALKMFQPEANYSGIAVIGISLILSLIVSVVLFPNIRNKFISVITE